MSRTAPVWSWLLKADEPWVRRGALVHLLRAPADDPEVRRAHAATLRHALVRGLLRDCRAWPGPAPLKSHKDAKHPLHKLALLADLGLTVADPPIRWLVQRVLAHQDEGGALQTKLLVHQRFGGSGAAEWSWMLCDAPVLLGAVLALGLGPDTDERVARAVRQLAGLARPAGGWTCCGALAGFRGPGRKEDPCPYATLVSLRALSELSGRKSRRVLAACRSGVEALLDHWQRRAARKLFLFGIGTDFAKPKYPLVWYDLLHVVEVLSRFLRARRDARFEQMLDLLLGAADDQGRFTPGSVWMAYKGFDFAQKRGASPTLTLAVERLRRRVGR